MVNKIALLLVVLVAIVACVQAQSPRPHHSVQLGQKFEARSRNARSIHHFEIGGIEINISEAPYQVSLQFFNSHVCSGSVLNNKWVLTAAHCTRGKSYLEVRLGSSQHGSGGTVVQIKSVLEHPLYNHSTTDYDFSLMELKTKLTFSDVVQPVALPEQNEPVETGTMAIVSGWGATHIVNQSADVLRSAYVPIMSQKDCRDAYSVKAITDRMMCAGYHRGGKDACRNDGGPLVAGGKLIGVVSKGFFCVMPGLPGVYGRVASVREWVREISGA